MKLKNLLLLERGIFQLPIETALIEILFSIMNYNKDKKRSRFNDATIASIMYTRDVKHSIDNVHEYFSQDYISFYTDRVSLHKLLQQSSLWLLRHSTLS